MAIFSCCQDSVNQSVTLQPFFLLFLAMKRWNFHFVMMQVKDKSEEMEVSLRQRKGRNTKGKLVLKVDIL